MTSKKEVVLTFSMFCQIRNEFRLLAKNRLKKRRSFGASVFSVALQKNDLKKEGRLALFCVM